MHLRSLLLPVLASALCASAAACGDGGGAASASPKGVPTLDGQNTDVSADGDRAADDAASEDPQERALAFARCMRENGIPDFPDPQVDANGGIMISGPGPGAELDEDTVKAAHEKCQPLMGDGPGSGGRIDPEEAARMQEAMLAFAKCMREHGVDFPDPEFSGDGGATFTVGGPGIDPEDPSFKDAEDACRDLMPKPGEGAVTASHGGSDS
jgi:hypothetical protein